jgi:hypothetical protein
MPTRKCIGLAWAVAAQPSASRSNETSINYDFASASPSDQSAYLQKLVHALSFQNLLMTG